MDGYSITLNESLKMKDPNGEELKGIHFFYACGLPISKIKDESGVNRRSSIYNVIQFFGQDQMEKYGVKF